MNISQYIDHLFSSAMQASGIPTDSPAVVKPSGRPEFGDYQVNGIMGAAKRLKTNPRNLAAQVLENVTVSPMIEKTEIAGPGFINVTLNKTWLATQLASNLTSETLGVVQADKPQIVVVDYSAPNLAKEMHVGHLRSTIIGDAVVRTLMFLGHTVIRQNHVGDWGTQFGMLLTHMADLQATSNNISMQLSDLESFYRDAKLRFDESAEFAERARKNVVKLQSGDKESLALWQQFINTSLQHCESTYQRLNVLLTRNDVMPESAYNDDLPHVVADLQKAQLLTKDAGAQCVFLDEFKGKEGDPLPTIVQKSDGGYLYATSDLAALRYRQKQLNANRILYFVDARQSLHLNQVFTIAKKAHFIDAEMSTEHMPFGTMMGQDGRPFKTRAGGTVKLNDLLDEAEERAFDRVKQSNPDLSEEEHRTIANKVGIGAVKYADLSKNRVSDYIFNWDSMLSFEGNTAPYLLYAYARINSIFNKVTHYDTNAPVLIESIIERQLVIKLLQFTEAVEAVGRDGMPNILCTYLHELSGLFMTFYEACPILKKDISPELRDSRLQLANATATTLKTGLDLLGIDTLQKM